MTSREGNIATLRAALEQAEADVLRLAVEAERQTQAIRHLHAARNAVLDELDHAQTKVRALNRAIARRDQP